MNNHTNGIDIYLLKSDTTECLGLANGIGTGTELLLYGSFEGLPLCTTHVISHEMGHILNLYHTHHGTSMVTMKMTMTLIAAQNCQITSSWAKGIYIVRAIVDKEILSEKITIQ